MQLVQQLARAVHAAHQRGIVHRDLKPANILLQPTPAAENRHGASAGAIEADQDYGVPKVTISAWPSGSMTFDATRKSQRGLVGTPVYMAPEQAKGRCEEIGPAADIYSLGVILYEMLTGRPPFLSSSAADVLRQVLSDPPVPPRRLRRELPRDLEAICRRCLEKDPRRRYPTASLLADDLGSFLDSEPVRARPPGARGAGVELVAQEPGPFHPAADRHRGPGLRAVERCIASPTGWWSRRPARTRRSRPS